MTALTETQRKVFLAIVREFDLPFSRPDAQQITKRAGLGESVTKLTLQILQNDGDLRHVGDDGPRKLWWWADEEVMPMIA